MAGIGSTAACLRFFGDDLDPDALTQLIGKQPTEAYRKGDARPTGANPGRIAKTGRWSIKVPDRKPGDLEAQIDELLAGASTDLSMWRDLSLRYRGNLFCGLFMKESNEGLTLSGAMLLKLGERGLELGLDIYDPTDE